MTEYPHIIYISIINVYPCSALCDTIPLIFITNCTAASKCDHHHNTARQTTHAAAERCCASHRRHRLATGVVTVDAALAWRRRRRRRPACNDNKNISAASIGCHWRSAVAAVAAKFLAFSCALCCLARRGAFSQCPPVQCVCVCMMMMRVANNIRRPEVGYCGVGGMIGWC